MFLFVIARLIDCNSFEEIHQIISLIISCLARNGYPEVEEYIAMLHRIINCDQEQVDLEIDYLTELEEELPNDLADSITYKSSSPYGRHFESVLNKSKKSVDDLENKYSDSLHLRRMRSYFAPNYQNSSLLIICPFVLCGLVAFLHIYHHYFKLIPDIQMLLRKTGWELFNTTYCLTKWNEDQLTT